MDIAIDGKATGPLAGVRVIELSAVVSGPLCGMILGDLGADVIKVENPPNGDIARYFGRGPRGLGSLFTQLNRNKRSVRLDLKTETGCSAYRRLVATADVVLENYRPGVTDRLGIGYEQLRSANPGLIYLAISGFGPDGPYAEAPAYDSIIQAMSGFATELGTEEEPALIRNLLADKTTALTASYSLMAALYAREKNQGAGQRIDIPMIDAFAAFAWADGFAGYTWGEPEPRIKGSHDLYATRDGLISFLLIEESQYIGLCQVMGREDLIGDERFSELDARFKNYPAFQAIVREGLAGLSTKDVVERGHRHGVPIGPVHSIESFMQDPQVQSNGTVMQLDDREGGRMHLLRSPPRYAQTPTNVRLKPPRLGENNAQILGELGYSDAEIEALTT